MDDRTRTGFDRLNALCQKDLKSIAPALGQAPDFVAAAQGGDFIYMPPCVPHQEENSSEDLKLTVYWAEARGRASWSISISTPSIRPN